MLLVVVFLVPFPPVSVRLTKAVWHLCRARVNCTHSHTHSPSHPINSSLTLFYSAFQSLNHTHNHSHLVCRSCTPSHQIPCSLHQVLPYLECSGSSTPACLWTCKVSTEWVWCVQLIVVCTVVSEWVWHVQLVVSGCGVCS